MTTPLLTPCGRSRPEPAGWRLRLMLEGVPMPWNWPVEVNYHDAKGLLPLADGSHP